MLIHQCACGAAGILAATAPKILRVSDLEKYEGSREGRLPGVKIIDMHNHVLAPDVEALVSAHPEKLRLQAALVQRLAATQTSDQRQLEEAIPRMTTASRRIADMDLMGIDIQVLSPSPTQYYYWAERDLSAKLVALQNERIIALCQAHPDRFLGLAAVSLQFPELAARQLEHAMACNFIKGLEISSAVGDRELADPAMEPFWAACETLGAVVFLHPLGTNLGARFSQYYFSNIIGHPIETTIALSRLIFSGTFDRYPKLRICAAHGGGYLPMYFGRSDHAWRVRGDAHACARPPSEYLGSLFFDSLVFAPEQLRRLVDFVGSTQVVLGTDYPFDMGSYEPLALTAEPLFSGEEQAALLGGNAARLLRLDTSRVQ